MTSGPIRTSVGGLLRAALCAAAGIVCLASAPALAAIAAVPSPGGATRRSTIPVLRMIQSGVTPAMRAHVGLSITPSGRYPPVAAEWRRVLPGASLPTFDTSASALAARAVLASARPLARIAHSRVCARQKVHK